MSLATRNTLDALEKGQRRQARALRELTEKAQKKKAKGRRGRKKKEPAFKPLADLGGGAAGGALTTAVMQYGVARLVASGTIPADYLIGAKAAAIKGLIGALIGFGANMAGVDGAPGDFAGGAAAGAAGVAGAELAAKYLPASGGQLGARLQQSGGMTPQLAAVLGALEYAGSLPESDPRRTLVAQRLGALMQASPALGAVLNVQTRSPVQTAGAPAAKHGLRLAYR